MDYRTCWSYFYPFYEFGDISLSFIPSDQSQPWLRRPLLPSGQVFADHLHSVVALVGDGCISICSSQDLITLQLIRHHIPLIHIVMNNNGYGWLQYQLNQYNFERRPFQFVTDAPLEH